MIDWFARNTVAANLLMMFILIGGLIAATNLTSETMPEISLDRILVDVPYLGAAPEEVEEAVCVRIEEAIYGTDGIKQIISTASEGMGSVMIELELGADVRRVLDDVKGRVDAIDTLSRRNREANYPRAGGPSTGDGRGRVGPCGRIRAEGHCRARPRRARVAPRDLSGGGDERPVPTRSRLRSRKRRCAVTASPSTMWPTPCGARRSISRAARCAASQAKFCSAP